MKIETELKCEDCGTMILVDSTIPQQRNGYITKFNRKVDLLVTYCECRNCGKKIIVQFDDKATLDDLRELTKIIGRRLRASGGLNKGIREGDKKKSNKIHKRLRERRQELMEMYKGRDFYTNDGKILI